MDSFKYQLFFLRDVEITQLYNSCPLWNQKWVHLGLIKERL